ncbi:hypothetical protein TOPH_06715 [Tolypocladium ophioglossoides CBS 100239]|uniref:Uncharacterized protein n=1 Tax=Tolypocladium ophioglossoides (strain CBS 100239) TaxID=1163406 RepID=A0A0L0N3S8_TOLOC|nr:hypothetical protein TOPH_06715 [Tolypocladium ophioglossoides CBS 100239]
MPRNMLLHNKLRSFELATEEESNFLLSVRHQCATESLRESIKAVVRHHLGLRRDDVCTVLPPESWIQGGFNLCVLVEVDSGGLTRRLVFRCPMPHKLPKTNIPARLMKKSVAKWPHIYGCKSTAPTFGSQAFTLSASETAVTSPTSGSDRSTSESTASSSDGRIVSFTTPCSRTTLATHAHRPLTPPTCFWNILVPRLGKCFYILRLNKCAMLPFISSFQFNTSDGTITLSNRPLTCTIMIFENSGTPRAIQPCQLYQSTDSFASDMLTLHDNHLLHDPYAVRHKDDARERMTIRILLRAVTHYFILSDQRNGPFLL